MASIILLQIFAAEPAPVSPQWITLRPIQSNKDSTFLTKWALPPHIKVRVPALAAGTAPATGVSKKSTPASLLNCSSFLDVFG
uniref:Uncharacterized protein n=1 Tax=Tetranychus urticae TaxID=32264 RepID=T1KPW1_TETUR